MKMKNENHLNFIFLVKNLDVNIHWKMTINPIIIGWFDLKYIKKDNRIDVIITLLINVIKIYFKLKLKFWKLFFLKFAILCFI